jgi:hypothetical protein
MGMHCKGDLPRHSLDSITPILVREDGSRGSVWSWLNIGKDELRAEYLWIDGLMGEDIRKYTGGRGTLEEFFLFMFRMKKGNTYDEIAKVFNLPYATVYRAVRRYLVGMHDAGAPRFVNQPLDQIWDGLRDFPNIQHGVRIAIDATEFPIARPKDYEIQRVYWSAKKGAHTMKILLACDWLGIPRWTSQIWAGANHDNHMLKDSNFCEWLQVGGEPKIAAADAGFQDKTNLQLYTPHKHYQGELTAEQRAENLMIGADRVVIENLNARLKRVFAILKGDKLLGQRLIMLYTIEAAVLLLVWEVQHRPLRRTELAEEARARLLREGFITDAEAEEAAAAEAQLAAAEAQLTAEPDGDAGADLN